MFKSIYFQFFLTFAENFRSDHKEERQAYWDQKWSQQGHIDSHYECRCDVSGRVNCLGLQKHSKFLFHFVKVVSKFRHQQLLVHTVKQLSRIHALVDWYIRLKCVQLQNLDNSF